MKAPLKKRGVKTPAVVGWGVCGGSGGRMSGPSY
jgi:hypothetical protein